MDVNELTRMVDRITTTVEEGGDSAALEGEIVQIVSFLLDEVEYGVNILQVHEIIRMPEITRLPNTPEYIRGVINLRGSVIPVVDVRIRFGFLKAAVTDLTRVIVIETGEKLVGLLVDNVHQVVRMPSRNIDPPSDLIEGISDEFIKGIGRVLGRLVVILNLDNILFSRSDGEKETYSYM